MYAASRRANRHVLPPQALRPIRRHYNNPQAWTRLQHPCHCRLEIRVPGHQDYDIDQGPLRKGPSQFEQSHGHLNVCRTLLAKTPRARALVGGQCQLITAVAKAGVEVAFASGVSAHRLIGQVCMRLRGGERVCGCVHMCTVWKMCGVDRRVGNKRRRWKLTGVT